MNAGLAVLAVLAGLSGGGNVGVMQEVEPATLTLRVYNPAEEYGTLFIRCGAQTASHGSVGPAGTTSFEVRVVDFCTGARAQHVGVQLEGGRYLYWDQEAFELTREPLPTGFLLCIDWESEKSTLWRAAAPAEVPPLCPDPGGSGGP